MAWCSWTYISFPAEYSDSLVQWRNNLLFSSSRVLKIKRSSDSKKEKKKKKNEASLGGKQLVIFNNDNAF